MQSYQLQLNEVAVAEDPAADLPHGEFARDLLAALAKRPRQLSPKYFYDAAGSALFDRICELPEYYLTRCELGLLTAKPIIYVFNVDEAVLTSDARRAELAALVAPAKAVFLDAKIESELIDLDPDDAAELLASTGQTESGLDQLARIGFDTLGLQTYLTAGPKETRAWTIGKGWKAPQAAGVIHTDFERGFIKAEIVSFDDLVAAGSIAEARARGKARIEGKDYVMQDGDVVEFRFNV